MNGPCSGAGHIKVPLPSTWCVDICKIGVWSAERRKEGVCSHLMPVLIHRKYRSSSLVVVLCDVRESGNIVLWVRWCVCGDPNRPGLCLFYIRCLLVGDQVDDGALRWAHVPLAIVLVLTVIGLCLGFAVLVVSPLASRLVLPLLGFLCISLGATVRIVRASGADPACLSLCV